MKLKPNTAYDILDLGDQLQLWQGNQKMKTVDPQTDLHLSENTTLNYFILWQDVSLSRALTLHLDEPGSQAFIKGAILGKENNSINFQSIIAHHAPHTQGDCLVKGVITDQATVDLKGLIRIDQTASNSTDQLTERLLMLSQDAQGQLQPELEILNNEVKASHATTIAHLDPLEMFYLHSRGLDLPTASELLITGFLQEVISTFPANVISSHNLLPNN